MAEIIHTGKRHRRVVSLTLDDGYKDNFTHGLPVFKALNIPFCIYVATRFPEKQMIYWWYLIEDIILQQSDRIGLSNGMSFPCRTKEEKEMTFLSVREEVLKLPQTNFNAELTKLLSNYPLDVTSYNDQLPLTWEMISQLGKEPLATIGCHTHSHFSMAGCTKEMIIEDIKKAHGLMRQKASVRMHHFAYPFGDDIAVKDYHRKIVEEFEFKTIATTNEGFISSFSDLLQLPRLFVTERNAKDVIDRIYYAC
jgi:peptidoglycan/xylan/chitin deacetylase (PgdA/CDA1 family)